MENVKQKVKYYKVVPLLWEERIVAAYSECERLATLLSYYDFYERVARLCWPISITSSLNDQKHLGITLTHFGNRGKTKREISEMTGVTWVEAQKMLNNYYKIFFRVHDWIKRVSSEEAEYLIDSCYKSQINIALVGCEKSIPTDWNYAGELSFRVPAYVYDVQVEKWLRHHFEREIEIRDKILKLPVTITS